MGDDLSAFRTILKKIMEERDYSASDIARFAGVRRNTVYYWLEGAVPRDLKPISALAAELKISFHYLLLGREEATAAVSSDLNKEVDRIVLNGHFRITIEPTSVPSKR